MPSMPNSTTTVALVADTHGFLDPRIAELARSADLVIHAGDVGGQAVLEELTGGGARVVVVHGNADTPRHWPPDEETSRVRLPAQASVELPGGTLVVEHGHRFPARSRHRRLREAHADAAAVVCGHSHRQVVDQQAAPWILNPGAAGRARTYGGPGCLILRAGRRHWHVQPHRFEPRRRS